MGCTAKLKPSLIQHEHGSFLDSAFDEFCVVQSSDFTNWVTVTNCARFEFHQFVVSGRVATFPIPRFLPSQNSIRRPQDFPLTSAVRLDFIKLSTQSL